MPDFLAWLQGRPDMTEPRMPISVGPELRAYQPKPSERFEQFMHELLGGGPGASLARENFARGVPKVLELSPLGIGLSAADLIHAKAANDPMGAAAAAIGMIPGAKGPAKEMISKLEHAWLTKTGAIPDYVKEAAKNLPKTHAYPDSVDVALGAIGHTLDEPVKQKETLSELESLKAILDNISPPKKNVAVQGNLQEMTNSLENFLTKDKGIPTGWEVMPQHMKSADWLHPDDFMFHNGQWLQKEGLPATKKAGQIPEVQKPLSPVWDYEKNGLGKYEVFDAVTGKTHATLDSEDTAKAVIKQYQDTGNYPKPMPTTTQKMDQTATKPSLDFEKDANGLYHIFDPSNPGKTLKVVDTPNQAKEWIAKGGKEATIVPIKEQFMDLPAPQGPTIPARPPWLGDVLPEAEREAARLAGGADFNACLVLLSFINDLQVVLTDFIRREHRLVVVVPSAPDGVGPSI